MARDTTAEEHIETTLHHAGVTNSGDVAAAVVEGLREEGLLVEDAPEPITPTMGAMDQQEHMAFILRIFMHFVETTPHKSLEVDLREVMKSTKGRQMQVMLDGPTFAARTIADLIVPTETEKNGGFIQ